MFCAGAQLNGTRLISSLYDPHFTTIVLPVMIQADGVFHRSSEEPDVPWTCNSQDAHEGALELIVLLHVKSFIRQFTGFSMCVICFCF